MFNNILKKKHGALASKITFFYIKSMLMLLLESYLTRRKIEWGYESIYRVGDYPLEIRLGQLACLD